MVKLLLRTQQQMGETKTSTTQVSPSRITTTNGVTNQNEKTLLTQEAKTQKKATNLSI